MAFVDTLKMSEDEVRNPSWKDVHQSLSWLPRSYRDDSLAVSGERGRVFLVVYWRADLGYYVSGIGAGERDYYFLTEGNATDEHLVWLGGDTISRPRHAFVSEACALEALKHFYDTGSRRTTLNWKPEHI